MNTVKIKSYAKINLTLEIVGAQEGYHQLDSLVASIDLFDLLVIKKRKDGQNRVVMRGMGSESIPQAQNNAYKTAQAFCEAFQTQGADITIYKNIPIGMGLGGSSADIVGVINGMAQLYGVTDKTALKRLADGLGSDTGYMLTGGFARMQGRGDVVTSLSVKQTLHGLLICPSQSVSARDCYQEYDKYEGAQEKNTLSFTENCIQSLLQNQPNEVGRYLTNDLFAPATRLNGQVQTAYEEALSFSPLGVVMTGSGSGVLALFESKELCAWAKSRYRGKFSTFVVQTVQPNYDKKRASFTWRNPFVLSEEEKGFLE